MADEETTALTPKEFAETRLQGPAEVILRTPAGVTISIVLPYGQTAGIASRTAETAEGVRTLTTIRTGDELEKVRFDFPPPAPRGMTCIDKDGKYLGTVFPDKCGKCCLPSGTVETFGGDPGDPPCP